MNELVVYIQQGRLGVLRLRGRNKLRKRSLGEESRALRTRELRVERLQ